MQNMSRGNTAGIDWIPLDAGLPEERKAVILTVYTPDFVVRETGASYKEEFTVAVGYRSGSKWYCFTSVDDGMWISNDDQPDEDGFYTAVLAWAALPDVLQG